MVLLLLFRIEEQTKEKGDIPVVHEDGDDEELPPELRMDEYDDDDYVDDNIDIDEEVEPNDFEVCLFIFI